MIWKRKATLDQLQYGARNTMVEHLGIKFTELGSDFLVATMPVTEKNIQPFGILHGGASVALAETLGSIASNLCIPENSGKVGVGLEINATHMRPVPKGEKVRAVCTNVRIGRTIHVWTIEIFNKNNKMTCTSRLIVSITDMKPI